MTDGKGHTKHYDLKCCAVDCGYKPKTGRKDHLSQHIRNKHQAFDSKFRCPFIECPTTNLSLGELDMHMKLSGHWVTCSSAVAAAANHPKCTCKRGLIVGNMCQACHSIGT
jgi:transcription elongation factor Elf1